MCVYRLACIWCLLDWLAAASILTVVGLAYGMQVAEAAAAQEENKITALTLRAEDAERKLADRSHKRQRQLAEITNLK
jgi:hypothetical protein